MKAIITAILIILLLIGCRNNSEQQSDTYFQRTGVSFTTGNEALQELFDSAETKVEKNIIQYNDEYRVMVEGAVYPFVFLETQPMAIDYPFKIALDSTTPGLTDPRDGNTYRTVKIGEQVWMAENLRFLPGVAGPGTGSKTTPYFYVYGYDGINVDDAKATANYNIYGVLYNWPAAMNEATSSDANPSGVQGVCPSGWHLPSDAEWTQLTDYLGTRVAGGKLKASGTTLWDPPNSGANNETGFSAFPGGYRNADGTFVSMGEDADFWSASEYNSSHAWFRNIHFNDNDVGRNKYPRQTGFAVRCVKD